MDFSQYRLAPEYLRREDEPGYDAQVWSPDWKCFACHDTGKVIYSLVRKIIPDYDAHRCKQILCKNPGCRAGQEMATHPIMADQLDTRFNSELCAQLHRHDKEGWQKITQEQQAAAMKKIKEDMQVLATGKTMKKDARPPLTENEQRDGDGNLEKEKKHALDRLSRLSAQEESIVAEELESDPLFE